MLFIEHLLCTVMSTTNPQTDTPDPGPGLRLLFAVRTAHGALVPRARQERGSQLPAGPSAAGRGSAPGTAGTLARARAGAGSGSTTESFRIMPTNQK